MDCSAWITIVQQSIQDIEWNVLLLVYSSSSNPKYSWINCVLLCLDSSRAIHNTWISSVVLLFKQANPQYTDLFKYCVLLCLINKQYAIHSCIVDCSAWITLCTHCYSSIEQSTIHVITLVYYCYSRIEQSTILE